jgi:hypothetical protein
MVAVGGDVGLEEGAVGDGGAGEDGLKEREGKKVSEGKKREGRVKADEPCRRRGRA